MWHAIFITQHNTNQTDIIVFLILCLVQWMLLLLFARTLPLCCLAGEYFVLV